MQNRAKLLLIAIVVLFIVTGFFREFLFMNINEQMRVSYYTSPDSHLSSSLSWLTAFDYDTLYYLKWPLTMVFAAIFGAFSALAVYVVYANKKLVKITWLAYSIVFGMSLAFFGIGLLTGSRETTYAIARFLAGIIETPAMLVILIASFRIVRSN